MIWDLIQIILLIAFVVVYVISLYQNNVLLRESDKMIALQESINASLKVALKKSVETCEFLHKETFELLEALEELEAERERWKEHALSMQRQLYQGKFFEEE